jgi:hypothetical protein
MPVLGIRINKIEATKNEEIAPKGPMRITPSQKIKDITENQINGVSGKVKVIEIRFEFNTNYDPAVGEINLSGTIVYQGTEKIRKEILKTWKDSKKIAKSVEREIIASLTSRMFLVAINCAREIGVPSPMPFKFTEE